MKDDFLVLIKGEDKTQDVVNYNMVGGKCEITYRNNKTYSYSRFNVEFISKEREYKINGQRFYIKGEEIKPIYKAIKYGDYIKIWSNFNWSKLYKVSEIEFDDNVIMEGKSKDIFEYLKSLAKALDGMDGDFLSRKYGGITTVSRKSILGLFLTKGKVKKREHKKTKIFPFGLNLSQRMATINALESNLSIVEGPPGTGKTQTILNIIANGILNDKTIAVVSNNNSATKNILDKLKKYNLDFLCAYLGNKENRKTFFENQKSEYPDLKGYKLDKEKLFKIGEELKFLEGEIVDLLEYKNKLAKVKIEFSELKLEYSYFLEYCDMEKIKDIEYEFLYSIRAKDILKVLLEYEELVSLNKKPTGFKITIFTIKEWIRNIGYRKNMFSYIKQLFKANKKNKSFFINVDKNILDYFKDQYYNVKICESEEIILDLEKTLKKANYESLLEKYTKLSMDIFKHKLALKYTEKRRLFEENILKRNPKEFLKEYPVVLSTTHSLRASGGEDYLFDYVIIDEASQVDIVAGGLALSCAKNAVIVGDLKQLPNIVTNPEQMMRIFNKFNIGQEYMYENSLLDSMERLFKDAPRTLLKEHYRCHPKIIGFCNKKFYKDELIIFTDDNEEKDVLKLYVTTKGNHGRANYNQREIDVILEEVILSLKDKDDIGIISPYRKQVNNINIENIESDTVHKYQGREKDTIIISTASNEINSFIDGDELINVAISRAVEKLILVTSNNIVDSQKGNIGDLINYIKYNNFEVIDSKIYSIFDFLYKDYEKQLKSFRKKGKNISEYDSENLMNSLLEEILQGEEFNFLDKVTHQPLQMLIKDKSLLSGEEKEFVMNPLSHTDFLIYNKVDKSPILVVEVDGYGNHNTEVQKHRDCLKDSILNKYGIEILRLKTNGSGEKEKLEKRLAKIIYGKLD